MRSSGPVIASNPVANTSESNSYSAIVVRSPVGVIASIGATLMSTRLMLSRLNIS